MLVSGGAWSTSHWYSAGLLSMLPAASLALTWKVCGPSSRFVYWWLVEQGVKLSSSSILHSNVEPVSSDSNWKLGLLMLLGSPGCWVIVVSGSSVSTTQV
jgi:hypothetical protein